MTPGACEGEGDTWRLCVRKVDTWRQWMVEVLLLAPVKGGGVHGEEGLV
jgi:hypothetical protein